MFVFYLSTANLCVWHSRASHGTLTTLLKLHANLGTDQYLVRWHPRPCGILSTRRTNVSIGNSGLQHQAPRSIDGSHERYPLALHVRRGFGSDDGTTLFTCLRDTAGQVFGFIKMCLRPDIFRIFSDIPC